MSKPDNDALKALVASIQKDVLAGQIRENNRRLDVQDSPHGVRLPKTRPAAPTFTLTTDDIACTHLFIDDRLTPGDVHTQGVPENKVWRIIKSYAEFDKYLKKFGIPQFISFDFNLDSDKTGHDCAKLLVQYCLENNIDALPDYLYHGTLESGRVIESYLMCWGKHKRRYKEAQLKNK